MGQSKSLAGLVDKAKRRKGGGGGGGLELGCAAAVGGAYEPSLAGPPRPSDAARAAAVDACWLAVADAPPDDEVRNILQLVCGATRTRLALIALVGDTRIWIIDGHNFQAGDFPWRQSFCAWMMTSQAHEMLIVPDAREDARFAHNNFVQSGVVRFYAGTPLISTSGMRIGTLCCADPDPRPFDEHQCQVLVNLASIVMAKLERSMALAAGARKSMDLAAGAAVLIVQRRGAGAAGGERSVGGRGGDSSGTANVSSSSAGSGACCGLEIAHANKAAAVLLGLPLPYGIGAPLHRVVRMPGVDGMTLPPAAAAALDAGEAFEVAGAALLAASSTGAWDLDFRPIGDYDPSSMHHVCMPASTPELSDEGVAARGTYFLTLRRAGVRSIVAPAAGAGGSSSSSSMRRAAAAAAAAAAGAAVAPANNGSQTPPTPLGGGDSFSAQPSLPSLSGVESFGAARANSLANSLGGSMRGDSATAAPGRGRSPFEGLRLGAPVASGSYGRVFKGRYFGARVAVKVLEEEAVKYRDPATGVCFEALLSKELRHPNIVATLSWRVASGRDKLPAPRSALIGHSFSGPSRNPGGLGAGPSSTGAAAHSHLGGGASSSALASSNAAASGPAVGGGAGGTAPAPLPGGATASMWDDISGQTVASSIDGREPSFCDDDSEQTWIIQEFCDKGCLQDAIDRGWLRTEPGNPDTEPDIVGVLSTAREIASGMAYLHACGVVHGDLSAYNVLLASRGGDGEGSGGGGGGDEGSSVADGRCFTAKIADFGLAHALAGGSRISTATHGTVTHAAPEVLEKGELSKAADVYSWGVLLWQMWYGNRPWAGMSHAAIVRAVVSERRSLDFGEPDGGAGDALSLLGRACMSQDPGQRPAFDSVLDILTTIMDAVTGADE